MRRLAKALLGSLLGWLARLSPRRVGVALLYHGVADDGRERRDVLVPASALLAAIAARRPGGRIPVAITFDDDDHTHPETAAPLLREAGATATFFVNAGSLDDPRPLWWRQLQRAWDEHAIDTELLALTGSPPDSERHRLGRIGSAITQQRPKQSELIRAALHERVGGDPALDGLSRTQLRTLAEGGFELGAHTARHDFLPVLTPEELEESVRSGREEIEAVAGRPVGVFAYPSGGWDATARGAVERAGYTAAFTARGGVVTPQSDPLALPRISPPTGNVAELSYVVARTLWESG